MPDQRALLRGRLASAIDAVADVASGFEPPASRSALTPPPPPPPPARPWSMAAAMEPIAPPQVERSSPSGTAASPPPLPPAPPSLYPPERRFPTAIIGSSMLALLVIVVVVLRLLPNASPSAPSPAAPTDQIALTAVRPVAPPAAAGGAVLPTQVSFAPGTTSVDIEVSSGGATVQAPVTVSVSAGPSAPPIIDATYLLNPSGETVITLTPPGGPFAAGDYSVAITANGLRLGATAFDVR